MLIFHSYVSLPEGNTPAYSHWKLALAGHSSAALPWNPCRSPPPVGRVWCPVQSPSAATPRRPRHWPVGRCLVQIGPNSFHVLVFLSGPLWEISFGQQWQIFQGPNRAGSMFIYWRVYRREFYIVVLDGVLNGLDQQYWDNGHLISSMKGEFPANHVSLSEGI